MTFGGFDKIGKKQDLNACPFSGVPSLSWPWQKSVIFQQRPPLFLFYKKESNLRLALSL